MKKIRKLTDVLSEGEGYYIGKGFANTDVGGLRHALWRGCGSIKKNRKF